MTMLTNIFLIGPMGVGKTTIGHLLAKALYMTFIDSDQEIEKRASVSIPLIFEHEGEAGFRQRERAAIADLTTHHDVILSTGGGVVLDINNRKHLQNRGYVIYLHASVDELLERTAQNNNRPLLQTENPRERLETILNERHPLYTAVADATIETGQRNIRQVLKAIITHLQCEVFIE